MTARPYRDFDDFLRIRQFLIGTYPFNGTYHNWEIRRWEGQWYWGDVASSLEWAASIRLWETEQGEIVGATHADYPGSAAIQVHPDYRRIEEEMIEWAESHLTKANEAGQRQLEVEAHDYDAALQALLARRGYTQTDSCGYQRRRPLDAPILPPPATPGYTLRNLQPGMDDCVRYTEALGSVWSHSRSTVEGVARFQTSLSYRPELHLVAEATDGSLAAFAGFTVIEANRTAVIEPVGTHPAHRRKHLAQALIIEGLHRLQPLGVEMVYLGTGNDEAANRLYEQAGFTHADRFHVWRKVWAD